MTSRSPPAVAPSGRLVSLDAFRGLTIAGMILVNNPGSWAAIYPPLAHAEWHGWTPTDLIFPYFLFIVGVAIPFSFHRRLEAGADRMDLFRHVLRRAGILILLGLLMRAVPDFDFTTMRWPGVLQRIGVVYAVAAGLYLAAGPRARGAWTVALLLGYWAAMTWVPVPGYGAGDLSPEGNLAAWLDRVLMDGHLYRDMWDPEGLLSSVPAVATSLLGIFTGEWLRSGSDGNEVVRGMMGAAAILIPLGVLWGLVFPINKNLWTSSYVVFTAGTALVVFSALYWTIDVKRWRGVWHTPLVIYGMNAIAVYVASGMLTKALIRIRLGGEGGGSLWGGIHQALFRSWLEPYNASLAFAISYVLFWLMAMAVLHRKDIHIKI